MRLSLRACQRMLSIALIASLIVWYVTGQLFDGMLLLAILSTLTGVIWGLSEKEMFVSSLNLSQQGILNKFAMMASIVCFGWLGTSLWDFPATGSYIFSIVFIGSFWATAFMIQPPQTA